MGSLDECVDEDERIHVEAGADGTIDADEERAERAA